MPGRCLLVAILLSTSVGASARPDGAPRIEVETGHPWRPPFGLDRVGRPLGARIEFPGAGRPTGRLALVLLREGTEIDRRAFELPDAPPYRVRVPIDAPADELAIDTTDAPDEAPVRLAKQAIPEVQAEAVARPGSTRNPVDLGAILVPEGWLLLGPGDRGRLDLAALGRTRDRPGLRLTAWYESAPDRKAEARLDLSAGRRADVSIELPPTPRGVDRDTLHAALAASDGAELWREAIPAMIVREPPRLPEFGATRLKLRFDAPISVRDPRDGSFSTLDYDRGWDPGLDDVVVSLPNGSRFVFWRGSSYIPFWAGRHNTGLCYEWAENLARPADAVDCVEPLMDKELRYGRVEVVASTPARVHVRWRYQSTDLHYKVWGDEAVEDYYFYPDGFGTRVVSLKHDPKSDYELSEFILLAPQDAYPLAVVPDRPIRVLGADGSSRDLALPIDREAEAAWRREFAAPALYRIRAHRDDEPTAIYFNPGEREPPPLIFGPFADGGEVVTPAYWGSHWPLARGNATGSAIDDRIHATPSHNSLMSWAASKPEPLRGATVETLDALGRPRQMAVRRWAWLIGMTDAPDDRLRAVAASFARPPGASAVGARPDFEGYAPERRALRLVVERPDVAIDLDPGAVPLVNPVFELDDAPEGPLRVRLDGRPVAPDRVRWDGRVLWLDAAIPGAARLDLRFDSPS
jgi:hypothetical protein